MNATILLPSREKPVQFLAALHNLYDSASHPDNVEVIARVDADDPQLPLYLSERSRPTRLIIGPRLTGYGSNHIFYEDCARLARGEVLILWNDDMQMETRAWDEIYLRAFEKNPWLPACSNISSPSEGRNGHYEWACAAVSRRLYTALGAFAIGSDPSIDRCYESLAKHLGGRLRPEVWINHDYQHSFEGTRGDHYAACHREWGRRAARWDAIGREYAAKAALAMSQFQT